MKRASLIAFFLFSVCFLFFPSLWKKESSPSLSPKKVFKLSLPRSVNTLDPLEVGFDIYRTTFLTSFYDRLYEWKYLAKSSEVKPLLAKSLPEMSDDGLSYRISLKEGVHFVDDPCFENSRGREVLAQDFIYSIKRHFENGAVSSSASLLRGKIVGLDHWKEGEEIEGLRALDSHTISIRLTKPFPNLLRLLTMAFTVIIPREAVEFYGKAFAKHPVGSGPWKLKSLDGKKAFFVKNLAYRKEVFHLKEHLGQESLDEKFLKDVEALEGQELPFCDEVQIDFLTNSSTAWLSFQRGDGLHYLKLPRPTAPKVFKNLESHELFEEYEERFSSHYELSHDFAFVGFNMDDLSFGYHPDPRQNEKNKVLRKALRYAFDWKEFSKKRFSSQGKIYPGFLPETFEPTLSELSLDSVTYQPEKAKELLKEAGWNQENLPSFVLTGIGNVVSRQNFKIFESFLLKIGYPKNKIVSKMYLSFNDLLVDLRDKKLPSFGLLTWGMDIPDANDLMELFYSHNKSPGMNFFNFHNPEFDELYECVSFLQDGEERSQLIKRANEILIEEVPFIGAFSPYDLHLWHKDFLIYPSTYVNFLKYVSHRP